jgi:Ser/Thr protein kinase RdoA (MazF antagonist)
MPLPSHAELREIAAAFAIDASAVGSIEPLGFGLINDTFSVAAGPDRFVLQRINARVFPDPERIVANLKALAEHAASPAAGGLRVPAPIPARDGSVCVRDAQGGVWRLMELIPDSVTLTRIETPAQAWEVGSALGRFHRLVAEIPPGRLGIALPGFHRTPEYLARLLAARERAPADAWAPPGRLAEALAFVDARLDLAQVLERACREGEIRERAIHGDPKIDNILFHREDGHALALIDLDTVQPGLIQHDLGDCLRSCCNLVGEAPDGAVQASFDLDLCARIVGAYASETRDFLSAGDIAALYDGIRLMPFELALRFLADHLEGDRYFRVSHRGQNLHKAQVQLALVADIEAKEREIRAILADAFALKK